ncbi:hypothetical protein BU25DRAFT_219260 [Macroventuria anomochaeta]|uniref:Uncharacterized protein n=1 Tax=Macroventuria anomochaeta TaxID=301207 RepID=A0ACB6RJ94_9PLEO|nr:uncharacterized protein BU25DRAFT_219260 [Macroventuria anomochaeta]KAF2621946.1 hypothetical protein BU25DRAFT_219260 [Macroventuria anomochaeta]
MLCLCALNISYKAYMRVSWVAQLGEQGTSSSVPMLVHHWSLLFDLLSYLATRQQGICANTQVCEWACRQACRYASQSYRPRGQPIMSRATEKNTLFISYHAPKYVVLNTSVRSPAFSLPRLGVMARTPSDNPAIPVVNDTNETSRQQPERTQRTCRVSSVISAS